jgi:hypothetical protein
MKTAVEWLVHMYALKGAIYQYDIDKALKMEIEQIVQAYANGQSDTIKAFKQQEQ